MDSKGLGIISIGTILIKLNGYIATFFRIFIKAESVTSGLRPG